ncbi:MAG: amidase [Pseudomonadota bacterium]
MKSGASSESLGPFSGAAVQAEAIRTGTASSEALVATYLARIEATDRSGPKLQSIIALNPNALEEARILDAEAREGNIRGPLHGVPVLVKDNIETRELPTTAGSMALQENDTGRDAPIIASLRAAGAIILGKTNLSEWANFRSTSSMSGWSGVGGQTKNPHSLDRSPCGSSSGSGAAIAAGFAPLAIGTETNGSIMCPASMNGIVGIKPTVGLLSRTHIVPISPTQDTAGPMTRSVADAALMLSVMAGSDPADSMTDEADDRKTDYMTALSADLTGLRIGVLRFAVGDNKDIGAVFDASLVHLQEAGAELVEIESFETGEAFSQSFYILQAEFKTALNEYLSDAAPSVQVRSLSGLLVFNEENSERELALFGQEILEMSEATGGMTDPEYSEAFTALRKASREDGIHFLLDNYGVDVLVAPSRPPAFLIDAVYGDEYPGGTGADYLAAIAGTPNMTVPMGAVRGLPVGMSFMGRAWDEASILRAGYAFEQRTNAILRPSFAASAFELEATAAAMSPLLQERSGDE